MRVLALAMLGCVMASCATGQSVGSTTEFKRVSAVQIGGGVEPKDIKIRNRRALLFTSYWTAVAPDGTVYECSRDLSNDQCVLQPG